MAYGMAAIAAEYREGFAADPDNPDARPLDLVRLSRDPGRDARVTKREDPPAGPVADGRQYHAWIRAGCPPAEGPHLGRLPEVLPDYTMASFRCFIDPVTHRCFACGSTVAESETGRCASREAG